MTGNLFIAVERIADKNNFIADILHNRLRAR